MRIRPKKTAGCANRDPSIRDAQALPRHAATFAYPMVTHLRLAETPDG